MVDSKILERRRCLTAAPFLLQRGLVTQVLHRKRYVFRGQPPAIPGAVEAVEGDDTPMAVTVLVVREGDILARGVYVNRALLAQLAALLPHCVIVGNGLWAKVYVPPGEGREHLRLVLRSNGRALVHLSGNEALTCASVSVVVEGGAS